MEQRSGRTNLDQVKQAPRLSRISLEVEGWPGTASVRILSTPDQIFHRRKERPVGRWFDDMRHARVGTFQSCPPAIDQEGYAPFLEARAKEGTVTVTERVIQDGGQQSVVLHQKQGVPKGVRRCQFCARVLKGLRNIHDDKGLILNDEN